MSINLYSTNLQKFLNKWPGKRYFGIYRFLPLFFGLGAALEFSMINWRVGETNFYHTYKKRQAKSIVEEEIHHH
ncbi:PREDICTED: small integral membrane protein 4 [Nicrophorus vespilloides]|uniref:Small integral membrane protein 4 n=1 Tax=Nicrophorus vespilloides TaxID=110193 RepID=A0ABM1M2L9_NICVS|nr:PREDICTED: small integral membrane protein 4 [Nicrophorus vespilloides]